jgi:hypothetical protein
VVCRAVSCLMPKRFRMSGLSEKGVTSPPVFGADGISRIAHGASRRSRSAVALETKAFRIIRARGSRVRSGLAAGAKGVRTTSPTVNGADMGGPAPTTAITRDRSLSVRHLSSATRGTRSSNPLCSSAESRANLSLCGSNPLQPHRRQHRTACRPGGMRRALFH